LYEWNMAVYLCMSGTWLYISV